LFKKIRSWINLQFEPAFGHQLQTEIAKTERLRITIVIWTIIAGCLAGILNFLVLMEEHVINVFFDNMYTFLSGIAILIIYELGSRRHVQNCILKRRPLSKRYRVINLFIETSFPTFLVLILLWKIQSMILLVSPIVFIYFLFIILSTLHLDFWLSVFTGFIAAVEYFFVSMLLIQQIPFSENLSPFLVSTTIILGRSIIMMVSGVAAGFVALEIKRRVTSTYKLVNERNHILQVLGQQVSYAIVDQIVNEKVEIGNKRLNVSVMFLDIRDFTPFAENRSPEEVMEFQNKIFGRSAELINKYNGIINQFLGDGFMATFGAPFSSGNDCLNAVTAAEEILDHISKLNDEGSIPVTRIGIGIHFGEAITGNVGTERRKQYSIVGNVVIQASRIEQLNKKYGSQLLVSKEVFDRIGRNSGESLGVVMLKGESRPVEIFRLR
jgi:adenylate cyclase